MLVVKFSLLLQSHLGLGQSEILENPYFTADHPLYRGTMKVKHLTVIAIVCLLVAALLFAVVFLGSPTKEDYVDVFVGIDVAYDCPEETKTLIDAVSPYTNVFIIGSEGVTSNETKLTELSQYIYDKGLSFIVFTQTHDAPYIPTRQWIENAKAKWGDRFLGLYVYDEAGGKHLDRYQWRVVREADNYTDARNQFVAHLEYLIQVASSNTTTEVEGVQAFTSDYGLYWFDYKAGYDTVFAEFGWNYSRLLNVVMARGAATAQNKDWGVMITWTYNEPPYLESGEKLYEDMVFAYENGAKYILIFDTNENYTHGVLREEHFQAIKQFTEYAHLNPRTTNSIGDRTAFVLPKDFGYGFRGPSDGWIWGIWEAKNDTLSYELSVKLGGLLEEYGTKLDVIYDDEVNYNNLGYHQFIFWNGTIIDRQDSSFP